MTMRGCLPEVEGGGMNVGIRCVLLILNRVLQNNDQEVCFRV